MSVGRLMKGLPLFPCAVVGSLPRPTWVIDMLERRSPAYVTQRREQEGLTDWEREAQAVYHDRPISEGVLQEALDRGIQAVIAMQEAAGLDVISDGEWRRRSFTEIVCNQVEGFRANAVNQFTSAVVAPLRRVRSIVADEARFLRAHTQKAFKIALPSPYLMTQRHWHPDHSRSIYPTRRHFMEALVPLCAEEIRELLDLGVEMIQFDDPGMCLLVDEAFRANFGSLEAETAMAVEGTNALMQAVADHPQRSRCVFCLHLCRAHRKRGIGGSGDYSAILDAVYAIQVDQYVMEFAVPQAGSLNVFEAHPLPAGRTVGLGVVDVRSPEIDDPVRIVRRVEEALTYLQPEQIYLNPDCGFAPGSTNPIPFDEAYRKLRAMTEAARRLREKHGTG